MVLTKVIGEWGKAFEGLMKAAAMDAIGGEDPSSGPASVLFFSVSSVIGFNN